MTNKRSPGDVGNDDTISPEVDIRGLAVVGEVLDVDCLLVQDEDVSGDAVRGPGEGAQVQRVILILTSTKTSQSHQDNEQTASLKMRALKNRYASFVSLFISTLC